MIPETLRHTDENSPAHLRRLVAGEMVVNNELNHARYTIMASLGKELLSQSDIVLTGEASDRDIELAQLWMSEGARKTMPKVWSEFWMHKRLAPRIGRDIATEAAAHGIPVNPALIQFLMEVEDVGRYILPGGYLSNDYVGEQLLLESGLPPAILAEMPSLELLMETAATLNCTEAQLRFEENLSPDQQAVVEQYFLSLSPTNRILNLVDNLSKRTENGCGPIFTIESFIDYLKGQEKRYSGSTPIVQEPKNELEKIMQHRRPGARLQAEIVQMTADWLATQGVSINEVIERHANSGPRLAVVSRHGEVANPLAIVYTLDHHMGEEAIQLSDAGISQLKNTGETLANRRFSIASMVSSDQQRAMQSAEALREGYQTQGVAPRQIPDIRSDVRLRDGDTPGPYFLRMTMQDFAQTDGRVDTPQWDIYHHERPEAIQTRMTTVTHETVQALRPGETAILVSHGDPSAMLLSILGDGVKPHLNTLRSHDLYPAKGEAFVVLFDDDPETGLLYPFTVYSLTGNPNATKKTF